MSGLACLANNRVPAHRARLAGRRWFHAANAGRVAAAGLLLPALPVMAGAILAGARVRKTPRLGQNGRRFEELSLATPTGAPLPVLAAMPRLLHIVRGEMGWVGPDPGAIAPRTLREEDGRVAASVSPGLVSTWWLRQRTNVAYDSQIRIDAEYAATRSARGDLGILVRAAIALLYGGPVTECPEQAEILGLPLDNRTLDEAIDEILTPLPDGRARQVSFLNVDCVNQSVGDREYRRILQTSDLRLGDGIGLRIAGRILRSDIRQNVNGTDLFPRLCERMEREGKSLFLLGGRPGVAEGVAEWMRSRHPGLRLAGARHGFFGACDEAAILRQIRGSGADVLLVALGAPRQEKWIRRHLAALPVCSALGVGGLFDFYSGRIPRAPQWMRETGLEWIYRLYQEPGRMWRRYLIGNVVFLGRVIVARIGGNANRTENFSK